MSCNVDKVKAIDGVMGADVIPVEHLSTELRTRLESPFPQQGQSGEWRRLNGELEHLYSDEEEIIVIQSSTGPIFRENATTKQRSTEFIAQFKKDYHLGENNSPSIFVQIDYTMFQGHFDTIEKAQKYMNEWCHFTNKGLNEFSKLRPKLIVHLCSSEDIGNPNFNYNNAYHSSGISSHFTEEESPTIIIDCGIFERHKKYNYEIHHVKPDFHFLYSILNSESPSSTEIIDVLENIGNGFAILHLEEPSMEKIEIVAKILEISCKLAIKYTVHSPKSNLIEDFLKQSFMSSRMVENSKTTSINVNSYEEKGIIPENMITKFSQKWSSYKGSSFYEELKKYDEIIEELDYTATTEIRQVIEGKKMRIDRFIRNNQLYPGSITDLYLYVKPWHSQEEAIEEAKIRGKAWAAIKNKISDSDSKFKINSLLGSTDDITATPSETLELFEVLYNLTYHQNGLWRKMCNLHHTNKDESLQLLSDKGIKFNLSYNLSSYNELNEFMGKIELALNKCESGKIKLWIYTFYNLKPRVGEKNE